MRSPRPGSVRADDRDRAARPAGDRRRRRRRRDRPPATARSAPARAAPAAPTPAPPRNFRHSREHRSPPVAWPRGHSCLNGPRGATAARAPVARRRRSDETGTTGHDRGRDEGAAMGEHKPGEFEYPDEAGYPDGTGTLDEGTAGVPDLTE